MKKLQTTFGIISLLFLGYGVCTLLFTVITEYTINSLFLTSFFAGCLSAILFALCDKLDFEE